MSGPFIRGFVLAFMLAAAVFTGLGFATRALLFQPPPERYYTRGFSFEFPAGWRCLEGGGEVVCDPPTKVDDAVLIVATKTVGIEDTYQIYRDRLSKPMVNNIDGTLHPTVLESHDVMFGTQLGVEGTQRGSELANYDTRYMATISGATAVLITFSCHASVCAALQPQIDRAAASVEVIGSTI